jgi:hypothetical protein
MQDPHSCRERYRRLLQQLQQRRRSCQPASFAGVRGDGRRKEAAADQCQYTGTRGLSFGLIQTPRSVRISRSSRTRGDRESHRKIQASPGASGRKVQDPVNCEVHKTARLVWSVRGSRSRRHQHEHPRFLIRPTAFEEALLGAGCTQLDRFLPAQQAGLIAHASGALWHNRERQQPQ